MVIAAVYHKETAYLLRCPSSLLLSLSPLHLFLSLSLSLPLFLLVCPLNHSYTFLLFPIPSFSHCSSTKLTTSFSFLIPLTPILSHSSIRLFVSFTYTPLFFFPSLFAHFLSINSLFTLIYPWLSDHPSHPPIYPSPLFSFLSTTPFLLPPFISILCISLRFPFSLSPSLSPALLPYLPSSAPFPHLISFSSTLYLSITPSLPASRFSFRLPDLHYLSLLLSSLSLSLSLPIFPLHLPLVQASPYLSLPLPPLTSPSRPGLPSSR